MNLPRITSNALFFSLLFAAVGIAPDVAAAPETKSATTTAAVPVPEANLTQKESTERFRAIENVHYDLRVDLNEKDETFAGTARVRFDAKGGAKSTFLDFKAGATIRTFIVNGRTLATPDLSKHRIELTDLRPTGNLVEIFYAQHYANDGRGLHRFQDPEDKRVYLYTQFEAYDAHQMFPCFDQPNIKGTLTLTVAAPEEWELISTTRETTRQIKAQSKEQAKDKSKVKQALWTFPMTPKMSSYLYSLHAGPYKKWEAKAGEIPLRLFARRSMAKFVRTDDWFPVTRNGLEFYGKYFGYPYPFQKYDQIIVPEFNAGAMENIAAITFAESYLHRGAVTREEREKLASVILHEMAHMWFGDLVTMEWWNGLWLNESFATFMSALSQQNATEFKESWSSFYTQEKSWAYEEDQLVTTHPIEAEVVDTHSAFTQFDGITYGKGAAVLKQLHFFLGDDAFSRGLQQYFQKHAYGSTRLEDFIGALSSVSDKDLGDWSDSWLKRAGVDSVRAEFECREDKIHRFALRLEGPDGQKSPRRHRTIVGLYAKQGGGVVLSEKLSVEYGGRETRVPQFEGKACPAMAYPNVDDFDYVKVRFDPVSLATIQGNLGAILPPLMRTMIWGSLFEMVRDAELKPQAYLALVQKQVATEADLKTFKKLSDDLSAILNYLPQSTDEQRAEMARTVLATEEAFRARLATAPRGSDWQIEIFDRYLNFAQSPRARDQAAEFLAKRGVPRGLKLDDDRRWRLALLLSLAGDERAKPFVAKLAARDKSERGVTWVFANEAAWPDLATKRKWFELTLRDEKLSFIQKRRALRNILPPYQAGLRAQLADDFYKSIVDVGKNLDAETAGLFTSIFMPALCTDAGSERLAKFVKTLPADVQSVVRKPLLVGAQEDERCVRIRRLAQ